MLTLDYQRLGLCPGERVLDIGCGEGRHAFEAYRRGAALVVALDLDSRALGLTRNMLWVMQGSGEGQGAFLIVKGDARFLPLPDDAFHRVICAETLEHIPSDHIAMAELARVLRPGGRLAVTVPRYFPERVCWALSKAYRQAPGGHVRIYRASQLVRSFEAVGLRFRGRHHAHALHTPYWWLRCLLGAPEDGARLPRWYHRLLVWDIEHAPTPLGALERLLNPFLGKSVILYFDKPVSP